MSLNNAQMLPARGRSMRQMNDVLNAEETILNEIEIILDGLYDRSSLLHEELVNEEWLEKHIGKITDALVEVSKTKAQLHVEILINIEKLTKAKEEQVIKFLNKWLPAHLAYSIFYSESMKVESHFGVLWQSDEIITMRQVTV